MVTSWGAPLQPTNVAIAELGNGKASAGGDMASSLDAMEPAAASTSLPELLLPFHNPALPTPSSSAPPSPTTPDSVEQQRDQPGLAAHKQPAPESASPLPTGIAGSGTCPSSGVHWAELWASQVLVRNPQWLLPCLAGVLRMLQPQGGQECSEGQATSAQPQPQPASGQPSSPVSDATEAKQQPPQEVPSTTQSWAHSGEAVALHASSGCQQYIVPLLLQLSHALRAPPVVIERIAWRVRAALTSTELQQQGGQQVGTSLTAQPHSTQAAAPCQPPSLPCHQLGSCCAVLASLTACTPAAAVVQAIQVLDTLSGGLWSQLAHMQVQATMLAGRQATPPS